MFIKASITGVDIRRGVCKCRREADGFTLVNVTWMDEAPSEGDPVWLFNSDGHFVVLGKRSRPGAVPEHIPSLTTSSATSPVGDIASIGTTTFGQGTSPDEVSGDKVMRSKGGAIIAALRGGSVIAKASHWAWVFISRFDHVVKIFSRNYEKHNEARSEVNVNSNGRVFSIEENYSSQIKSREGVAEHKVITGDVAAGDELKLAYRAIATSAASDVVRREVIEGASERLYQSDLEKDGSSTIKNMQGENTSTFISTNTSHELKCEGGMTVSLKLQNDGTLVITADSDVDFVSLTKISMTAPTVAVVSPNFTVNGV